MGRAGGIRWARTLAGLALAGAVLSAPVVGARALAQARARRVAEEAAHRARDGAALARDALALQTDAVALMAANAVANPRFLSALRGRVSRGTFADLLATETWWEPYRELLAAISYDGATLAFAQTDGPDGVPVLPIVKRVAETGRAATAVMSGGRGAFLVAACPAPLGHGRAPAVLVLARPLDGSLLELVSENTGRAVLLSDGRQSLGWGGVDGALLVPLPGRETAGAVALPTPATHAAAIAIAPGLWLWALGQAADFEGAAVAADHARRKVLWSIAIPLAAAVAALSVRPRRRIEPPARLPASPRALAAAAPPMVIDASATRVGVAVSAAALAAAPPVVQIVRPGPGTALGRYLLVDQIGIGGMAEVFTAVSFGYGGFRRPFVIKRLRAELDGNATAVGLFIDEANLASTLVHPNVVPVFDFGEVGGSYFLAEEYIVGRDLGRLTNRLRERGEPLLSRNAILHLGREILNGLAYAHDKRDDAGRPLGLVHRDITPENVIISERGEVKILDFGIMKARQRVSQTESGTVRGNVGFMSPEQARGRVVDQRSDLFSTGLVLLYAATGEPTYPGESFYDLLTAAAAGPAAAQQARIAALPSPLPAILTRALAVDPEQRFQSSAEFSAAIAPHLEAGGAGELALRVTALFGDALRAEQERLAAAGPAAPRPEPLADAAT
ncbi:MAG TPA: serine/threonine-protein kinase [Polyangia bacterium]|jgi:serine/threonine-protein kinase